MARAKKTAVHPAIKNIEFTPATPTPKRTRKTKVETITVDAGELDRNDPDLIDLSAQAAAIDKMEKEAEAGTAQVTLPDVVKATKRRKPSVRDRDPETTKVIRRGRNLSGNQPFARKFYFLDPTVAVEENWTDEYKSALEAAPMQVRLILRHMRKAGIASSRNALQGRDIVEGAINAKVIQTKIDPAQLFAYYRRVMEKLGLRLGATEGLDGDEVEMEDEDEEGGE